MMTSKNYALDP